LVKRRRQGSQAVSRSRARERVIHSVDDRTPKVDTATPIKRVIYLMLENRSFNGVFGRFPGVVVGWLYPPRTCVTTRAMTVAAIKRRYHMNTA
jgi:phospholipase C